MIAATWPRDDVRATRLLRIDARREAFSAGTIGDLRTLLRAGDLLVVNDAATLPASLRAVTLRGEPVEIRLAGGEDQGRWRAVLFGPGDWRTKTEDRLPPPRVSSGDVLLLAPRTRGTLEDPPSAGRSGSEGSRATIVAVDADAPRLVELTFDRTGAELWRALYRAGRPVQYAYVARPLAMWHVQTPYAARPWAAEAPSAGFALTWELLLSLRTSGVGLARVTHAAGLSSTGDEALDARLPLAERYELPDETVRAIDATKAHDGRVIAVGTTVTRALEGAAAAGGGVLAAGAGTTDFLLSPATRRRIVDGIVTGVHDVGTSHFRLLEAFAPRALLERAHELATREGYRGHEFGDAVAII